MKSDLSSTVADFLRRFRLIHFSIVFLIFFIAFQFENRIARVIACALGAALFALPIAVNLSKGISDDTIIAGFIPYKDGFYYYNGANMLLSGQRITPGGLQGAFRPLFPGWISILLLVTNHNLLAALGLMVLVIAYCCYFAAEELRAEFGPLPAALFFTLTYAFIRPMLGDTLTELPSLAFACLSLVLLISAAKFGKFTDALLGGIMLVLAVSIRAGAFFILPFLVLWLGWRLRGKKKFSISVAAAYGAILLAVFLVANMLFTRLVTEQGDSTFGNFSWMLYGQAVGGAGFNYHLEALGTHDSTVVLQAALERIRAYPLGLLIGFAKAYQDFFTNNSQGMFDLLYREGGDPRKVFWLAMIVLLVYGLVRSIRKAKKPLHALLLACFVGLLFSIPFLPPIDGGNRFYSGSVPLLFALMTINLPALQWIRSKDGKERSLDSMIPVSLGLAVLFTLLLLVAPLLILHGSSGQEATEPAECVGSLAAVEVEYSWGTYVDILPDEAENCGSSPELCFSTFAGYQVEQANDDFYMLLVNMAEESAQGIRVWAGVEWASGQYAFIILPLDLAADTASNQRFSACAESIETQFQRVYNIQSIQ